MSVSNVVQGPSRRTQTPSPNAIATPRFSTCMRRAVDLHDETMFRPVQVDLDVAVPHPDGHVDPRLRSAQATQALDDLLLERAPRTGTACAMGGDGCLEPGATRATRISSEQFVDLEDHREVVVRALVDEPPEPQHARLRGDVQ
jgi:hypothetical protein